MSLFANRKSPKGIFGDDSDDDGPRPPSLKAAGLLADAPRAQAAFEDRPAPTPAPAPAQGTNSFCSDASGGWGDPPQDMGMFANEPAAYHPVPASYQEPQSLFANEPA